MGIIERVENVNRSKDIPRNRSLSDASVTNERSDGHARVAEIGQDSSTSRMMILNFNILRRAQNGQPQQPVRVNKANPVPPMMYMDTVKLA